MLHGSDACSEADLNDDICFMSARALLGRYGDGSLSPVQVVSAILARVDSLNPTINALFAVNRDTVLVEARVSEERWRRRAPKGLLDGVPVTLKDTIQAIGLPSPRGSRAHGVGQQWQVDAPVTQRLKESGALILGKTTMPDFGALASGVSSLHGTTHNPWRLDRNPGGSSSGAGAALAAGFCPLAIGTDVAGSIRIPAAFCGVFGLKPTYGRVPISMPVPAQTAGPMAREVGDAALLMNVITRPDERDFESLPYDAKDYVTGLDGALSGRKIGLLLNMGFGLAVEPEIAECIEAAAARLENAGATIVPISPIFQQSPEPVVEAWLQARGYVEFSGYPPELQAQVEPAVAEFCRKGAALSAWQLVVVMNQISYLRARVIEGCAGCDFIVSPTMPVLPFDADQAVPAPGRDLAHMAFTFPFSLTGQPAASVPCGFAEDGLPIGLQIVGKRFDDAGVLSVARAVEVAVLDKRDWPMRNGHNRNG